LRILAVLPILDLLITDILTYYTLYFLIDLQDGFLDAVWQQNNPGIKSIWEVQQDKENSAEVKVVEKDCRGVNQLEVDGPRRAAEIEKGGRLQMDEIYNQLEELETERRHMEALIGFPAVPYEPTPRAAFNVI
jgi:hypothetical protein